MSEIELCALIILVTNILTKSHIGSATKDLVKIIRRQGWNA
ncbi:hypothetical protein ACFRDV_42010 [Streptomyces fagopyri]